MFAVMATISAGNARRLLLHAQGLMENPERPATAPRLRSLVERLGYVQIDSINVVERAHHLTLGSRLDRYTPKLLTRLLEHERSLFEHWTHDASAIPVRWFPHWRHRFERNRTRIRQNQHWCRRVGEDPDRIIEHVRDRIRDEGPLQSRDFSHEGDQPVGGWWNWKPQKAVLEYLWLTGELAIARRENFQKVYDLTERVLPEVHALPTPTWEEHVDWACRSAIERLGAATEREIAAFWQKIPIAEVRHWAKLAVKRGEIEPVLIEAEDESAPQAAYAVTDWRERIRRLPDPPDRLRLLCPFDPVVRDRQRLKRRFDFDYRFEAFVPEAKRRYGYYVLPILDGARLVGRLDPKFHRQEGWLEIRRVWWEPGIRFTRSLRSRLEEAVNRLAVLIGADQWSLPTD